MNSGEWDTHLRWSLDRADPYLIQNGIGLCGEGVGSF